MRTILSMCPGASSRRPAALGDIQTKPTAIQGNRKTNGLPSHDESVNVGAS